MGEKNTESVNLHSKKRQVNCTLNTESKVFEFEVSRNDCRDVLVEFIDKDGNAQCKPLAKCVPLVKIKKEIFSIRFTMNDMSTKPIEIIFSS